MDKNTCALNQTLRQALRNELREKRNALPQHSQWQASESIVEQICQFVRLKRGQRIATYLSNDGELDLNRFHQWCWSNAVDVNLPVIHPFHKHHLLMLQYTKNTTLVANRFGIQEPALSCPDVTLLDSLDVVLLPLVGFDERGNRLGMGGGFYDRTLASLVKQPDRPKFIGIAHDCQQVKQLPVAPWDVTLDAIITPTQAIG